MTTYPDLNGPMRPPASGGAPRQLIVLLHGVGADGNDLIGLAPHWAHALPDAAFHAPDGPAPCDMAPFGRQWFSLADRAPPAMLAGLDEAVPTLNRYLDNLLARYELPPEKLALVGFSQGAMLSLHVGLRRPLAGIVGYSGALIGAERLERGMSAPPVLLVHGVDDQVVPFAALDHAAAALRGAGVAVEALERPGLGHGIDGDGLLAGATFLSRCFNNSAERAGNITS